MSLLRKLSTPKETEPEKKENSEKELVFALEEKLRKLKVCKQENGWKGLDFYPSLYSNYSDGECLYLVEGVINNERVQAKITDEPVNSFSINVENINGKELYTVIINYKRLS